MDAASTKHQGPPSGRPLPFLNRENSPVTLQLTIITTTIIAPTNVISLVAAPGALGFDSAALSHHFSQLSHRHTVTKTLFDPI